jgi:hypothetical protein
MSVWRLIMVRNGSAPVARVILTACCLAILVAGCSEKGGGSRFANTPPETFITYGPIEDSPNFYEIAVQWYGADTDGRVEAFEVVTLRDVTQDLSDTLDYETLPWVLTTSNHGDFVLPADSCCSPEDDVWYSTSLWGLLVRAIDNEGTRDPDPASIFFQASNQVPKVTITAPWGTVWGYVNLPPHFYLEWEGDDPDGNEALMSYKYIVIPETDLFARAMSELPDNPWPGLPPFDTDSSGVNHGAPPNGYWSEWVPSDCTYVRDLDLSDYAGTDEFIYIFVTAMDEAGAVLPPALFGGHYNLSRNRIRVKVGREDEGVPIVIDGAVAGRRASTDPDFETKITYLYSGTEVRFTFWGLEDESHGQAAEAFRFYYDFPDGHTWDEWTPVDPLRRTDAWPEWVVRFPADPFAPMPGPHVFVVEVRDLGGTITQCMFHLEVLDDPEHNPERSILLVDDNVDDGLDLPPSETWHDELEDNMWTDILAGYNWDVFDTGPEYGERVSAELVGSATTVIWAADKDTEFDSQLFKISKEYGNYLHSYVKAGGNLIIIGRDPIFAHLFWPDGSPDLDVLLLQPIHCWDFRRKTGDDSLLYHNFNWDIFGIKEMCIPYDRVDFRTLWPCRAEWDTVETRAIPEYSGWDGVFDNAFFITEARTDIEVQRLYGVIPLGAGGEPGIPDCTRWLAVYVPGDDTRGHAAYIGLPPLLCDQDQVKAMVTRLLGLFGEYPSGP